MRLTVSTDPAEIIDVLDAAVLRDPVRATVLGTVRQVIASAESPDAWCAYSEDRSLVAARSALRYPVVAAGRPAGGVAELAAAVARLDPLHSITGPAELIDTLVPVLTEHRPGLSVTRRAHQRLFRLDALVEPAVPGRPRLATGADRDLLVRWVAEFIGEAGDPVADPVEVAERALRTGRPWLWLDTTGRAASMALSRAPESGSARIGPVYTPPDRRGLGYGSAATAAATRDILAAGAIPVLFTDLANPVSNAIYPRLGYYPVEDQTRVHFG